MELYPHCSGPPVLNLIYQARWQYENIRETLLRPRSWSEQTIRNCLKQMPSIIGHWDSSSCIPSFFSFLFFFFCRASLAKTNPPFHSLHSHCAKIPMATDMCNSLALPPPPTTSDWLLSHWGLVNSRTNVLPLPSWSMEVDAAKGEMTSFIIIRQQKKKKNLS